MLLKWTCILLIFVLADLNGINCGWGWGSSSNKNSGSSSSSRGSSYGSSGSRGSSYGSSSSRGSSYGSSSSSGSRGSYGWATSRPVYQTQRTTRYTTPWRYTTTSRPWTQWTTKKRYPITTMPTRTWTQGTTSKRYPITTMPTHRTTRTYATTRPTFRTTRTTTRQSAYNPFFTSTVRPVNSGRSNGTSRQPAFNPFFTSTSKPVFSQPNRTTTKQPAYNPFFSTTTHRPIYNNSNKGTTRQSAFNPFFSTTYRPTVSGKNNITRQPAFNPIFSTTTHRSVFNNSQPIRNNGTNWNTTPRYTTSRTTPKPFPSYNNHTNTKFNNTNSGNYVISQRPIEHTTKYSNIHSGIDRWRSTTAKPIYNNTKTWIRPTWNSPNSGSLGNNSFYHPPTRQNYTASYRPSYITGSHPPSQPLHTGTTIINNNNYHYHPGTYYHPTTGTSSHVTVINTNNYYNGNHHVIIPSRHYYAYGPPAVGVTIVNTDYYSHPHYVTSYHYSTRDTGSTALGFFLGYQLGRISRPSYYYHSTTYVNNEYVPRYDHYTVHHYYHNSADIPKESPIQPNAIVLCPGDSGVLCPPGNTPLCTNNGAVMCVVNAQSTAPCRGTLQGNNCVSSTISCQGNTGPECQGKSEATVSIPCVSTATIDAGLGVVNNSLIVVNTNDASPKQYCVTVLALPSQSKNVTTNTPPPTFSQPFQYTTNHTGVGLLGYYLGSKLQNLSEPSYSYLNYDNNFNYIDKFDHYNVFHYDHGANVLPNQVDIQPEQIMKCAGDSGTFCPQNLTSVCLTDGAVFCATDTSSTIYSQVLNTSYVYSNISCNRLKSPACIQSQNNTIPVQIPCMSTAKLYADSHYMIRNYSMGSNIIYYKTLEPFINETNGTGTAAKIATPRELCVTILALPGEKTLRTPPKTRKVSGLPTSNEFVSLPKYTYTSNETGSNIFGFALANRLGTLAFPTYYYINAFLYTANGVIQKYDHYSVHYYDHGREILPKDLELQNSEIRGCEGDSGLICPKNTNVMCINDGSVWCVTDVLLTKFCHTKNENATCVKSEVSCEKNKYPSCNNLKVKNITLACAATLTVYGDIMEVDHSIYKRNPAAAKSYTELVPIPNGSNSTAQAQHFCVVLVNIPVERKISEGEKIFESSDSLFGKIVGKIFG